MILERQRDLPRCRYCGHIEGFHEHYRPGTECAAKGCDCGRYRGSSPLMALVARLRAATVRH